MNDLEQRIISMARIGSAHSPAFSPDGSRIAFVANLTGLPQIWTMPAHGGYPELVTKLDDPCNTPRWSPDGRWLSFSVAPGGGMNQQVYLARPDSTGLRCLTDGGRENNWPGLWRHDAKALAIVSNRASTTMGAYLYHLESGEWQLVADTGGLGLLGDLSRDGRLALIYRMVSRGDANYHLKNLATGEEVLLTPHEGPASFGPAEFSPDARTVYLSSNAGRDLIGFARIELDPGGHPGPIEILADRPDAELQDFRLTKDGRTGILLWNAGGRTELEYIDLINGERSPAPNLPVDVAATPSLSSCGRYLAFAGMGAATSTDIWLLDRESGTYTRLTHSPHVGVDLASLVRPELVRFPAHDGLELTGWLYRPHGFAAPGPVVLSFHGGPEGQERPLFNANYQALLAEGIAVLAPNVRGSSGFGKRFVNLDNGPLRFDAIRDIKACVDYVVGAGVAAPGRIGIMGGSYGGYMTMAGLAWYPDLLAAGANLYGLVNFATFFAQTEPWMAAVSKVEYGDPDTQADLLYQLSPINRLDSVQAPTLVIHGANDTNCPVVEAEQVVEHLQKRGVPVEYILYPDEGHGFVKEPNRIRTAVAIVRWFVEHLKR